MVKYIASVFVSSSRNWSASASASMKYPSAKTTMSRYTRVSRLWTRTPVSSPAVICRRTWRTICHANSAMPTTSTATANASALADHSSPTGTAKYTARTATITPRLWNARLQGCSPWSAGPPAEAVVSGGPATIPPSYPLVGGPPRMRSDEGPVAGDQVVGSVEVDLRLGRLREAPVAPTDLDVALDRARAAGLSIVDRRRPPDHRLARGDGVDIEAAQPEGLPPVPRAAHPETHHALAVGPEHEVGGRGHSQEPPQGRLAPSASA